MTLGRGGGGEESKSTENELFVDILENLNVLLTGSDDESEYSDEDLVEEDKLKEIMQELYKEITSSSYNTSPPTVTLPSPSSSLSLSSLPFFAFNNVNSESCGASMSDSSSTVMAGIDFVAPGGKYLSDVKVGLTGTGNGSPKNELCVMGMGFNDNNSNNVVRREEEEEKEMDGCDEGEFGDDQWLARVLGWGPLELEEWT